MPRQDTENLFRRYKNQVASIRTISGGLYKGKIADVTNDFVAIVDHETAQSTFVLFSAIESVLVDDLPTNP